MSGFTVPQLVLLEAGRGITRRDFLKFLGKGTAVVANPDKVTRAVDLGLRGLTGPVYFSTWVNYNNPVSDLSADRFLSNAFGAYDFLRKLGVDDINLWGESLTGVVPSQLVQRLIKLKGVREIADNVYQVKVDGVNLILTGPGDNSHYGNVVNSVSKWVDVKNRSSLLKGLVSRINYLALNNSWKWRVSSKLRSFLADRGLGVKSFKQLTWDDLPEFIKSNIKGRSDEELMELPERLRPPKFKRGKRKERVSQRVDWVPRAGYERVDQFDPRSSVYSPPVNLEFEERLRVELKGLVNE